MLPRGFTDSWKKSKFSDLKFKQDRDQQLEYFIHQVNAAVRQLKSQNEQLQSELDDFQSGVREKIESRLVPVPSKITFNNLHKTFTRADSADKTQNEQTTAGTTGIGYS